MSKIKAPSGQTVRSTAVMAGGAVTAGMLSNGAFGLVHDPNAATGPAFLKEHELLKRLAFVAVGAAAMMYAPKGLTGDAVKGAGLGMVVVQGMAAIASIAAKSNVTPEAQATTPAAKFLARTVGLGCPCNTPSGLGNANFMDRWPMMIEDSRRVPEQLNTGSFTNHPVFRAVETHGSAA